MTLDPAVTLLIAIGGALLFGSAAAYKLSAPRHFAAVLRDYRLLPGGLVRIAAVGIVVVELALTSALAGVVLDLLMGSGRLIGSVRAVASAGATGLLVAYAAAMEINLMLGRQYIDCGCGGFGRRGRIARWMVLRNLILAGMLGLLELPLATRALAAIDVLTVLGGVSIAALLYLACDTLSGHAAALESTAVGHS